MVPLIAATGIAGRAGAAGDSLPGLRVQNGGCGGFFGDQVPQPVKNEVDVLLWGCGRDRSKPSKKTVDGVEA